jgi:hypothetical protein
MALSARREAFRVDNVARGLDHQRTQYLTAFGDYVANATTTFSAGMLVDLNSSQEVIISVGVTPYGWCKYNKDTGFYASVVGEYIQLNGLVATSLEHANVRPAVGGAAGVRVAAALTGAAYTEGAGNDYSVNYTNGTVVRDAATTIADGAYVYVNYQYALTAQELNDDGHNFWNFDNDVTIQGNKVTVITGEATIYTTAFDSSQTYSINDALTAGTTAEVLTGMVTKGGAGAAVGRVVQVPTPDDPYLGIRSTF